MTTIDNLMPSIDNLVCLGLNAYNGTMKDEEAYEEAREALRTALVEALGPETWTDDGGWTFEIEQQDHIVDANEMVVQPVIGCVGHDCSECKAREAQPAREPLTDEQINAITREQFDLVAWRGTRELNQHVARAVERAHGIGGER